MNYLEQGYYACLLAHSNKDTIIPTVETLNSISHFEQTLLSNLVNNKDYKSLNTLNVDFLAIKVFFGVANIKGIEKIAKKIFETYPAPILELILENKVLYGKSRQ